MVIPTKNHSEYNDLWSNETLQSHTIYYKQWHRVLEKNIKRLLSISDFMGDKVTPHMHT